MSVTLATPCTQYLNSSQQNQDQTQTKQSSHDCLKDKNQLVKNNVLM